MRKRKLFDVLFPRTRGQILTAVFTRPDRAWYASELARHMGVPSSSLQRELATLTRSGLLRSHRQGRMTYFRADPASPVFPELRGLVMKTAGLVDVLADALVPVAARVRFAFVYGSVAAGTESADSDVDLMVVGTGSAAT